MGEKYWAGITSIFDCVRQGNGTYVVTSNHCQSGTAACIEKMDSTLREAWKAKGGQNDHLVKGRVASGFLYLSSFPIDFNADKPTFKKIKKQIEARGITKARIYVDVPRYAAWGYES